MKKKYSLFFMLSSLTLALFSGCTDISDDKGLFDNPNLKIQTRLATESTSVNENNINNLFLAFFAEGRLVQSLNDVTVKEDGSIEVPMNQKSDKVYLLSEYDKVFEGELPQTESEFIGKLGRIYSSGNTPIFMTGKKDFTSNESNIILSRGVSRLDIAILAEGVEVKKIDINSVYTRGYLFPNNQEQNISQEYLKNISKDFSSAPLKGTTEGIFYLYEQKHEKGIPVSVTITKNGEDKTIEGNLPATLERNRKYSIILTSSDNNVGLDVKVEEWGKGEDTGLYPDIDNKILIDTEKTILSHGAYISATRDTLYIPYWDSNVELAFVTEHDLEYNSKDISEIEISVAPRGEGFQLEDKFIIKSNLRAINSEKKYIHLGMRVKGKLNDVNQIVVALQDHQIKFRSDKELNNPFIFNNGVYDYGRYKDGTLCYLQLPQDHKVVSAYEKGRWVRIDEDSKNGDKTLYRVEGGYKPNDITANGDVQVAEIEIERPTAIKGQTAKETYVFKRQNWGLPVVEINGTYWAKYNLRGNVKSFTDQVQWNEDKELNSIVNGGLVEYLKTRVEWKPIPGWEEMGNFPYFRTDDTTERIYKLMGHGYLGNNPEGMTIKAESATSDKYFYEEYKVPAKDINLLPETEMAPDGYQLPSPENIRKLLPSDLVSLKRNSENPDKIEYTLEGKNITLEAFPMDYYLNGGQAFGFTDIGIGGRYGYIMIAFITVEGSSEPLILIGHKPQIEVGTNSTKDDCVFFACSSGNGRTFALNARNGDYKIGIQDLNSTTTGLDGESHKVVKMIRCVKTPVNYIME